jgi:hypothetical protein
MSTKTLTSTIDAHDLLETVEGSNIILPGCCHSQGPLLARIAGVDYQECQEHSTIKNAKNILPSRMPRAFSQAVATAKVHFWRESQEWTIKNAKSILPGCCHSQGPPLAQIAGVDNQEQDQHYTERLSTTS